MLPVVTPAEMRAIDAAAPVDVATLIERAGWATAVAARALLGSTYGRRVLVLAGPGNNGADGRSAARVLATWGAVVTIVDATAWRAIASDACWQRADLVIDAAFGTGLSREFDGPDLEVLSPQHPLVLAVDTPSGIDGNTGEMLGNPMRADATITFGAHKPGLLFGNGPLFCGPVTVVDLELDTTSATVHLLDPVDVGQWPRRDSASHKWRSAVWVIGGDPTMPGAPVLAVRGAARAGAGYVLASIPGVGASSIELPIEAVARSIDHDWAQQVIRQSERIGAFVIGPGLSPDDRVGAQMRKLVEAVEQPVVLDAGALDAVAEGSDAAGKADCLRARNTPAVLTPHDGEFARLMGEGPGPDRLAAARAAAKRYASIVLLKGPTTVVAHPDGRALLSNAGDARLATAGTGDVLSGVIGAGLAKGLDPFLAAGLGAELHGRAASRGFAEGLVAGDVPDLVAELLSSASSTGKPPLGDRR